MPGARTYRTLCEAFQATADAFADEVALRTPDDAIAVTWAEYRTRVERAARGLSGLAVGRGDTVALMLANRPEFHILDTAAVHLGATPFSVYATSTVEQIAYVFANAGNRVVVTERAFLERVLAARASVPAIEHVVVIDGPAVDGTLSGDQLDAAGEAGFDLEAAWRSVSQDDVATLIYTSGTTGQPKGVMITHANLLAAWDSSVAAVPFLPTARPLRLLPADGASVG